MGKRNEGLKTRVCVCTKGKGEKHASHWLKQYEEIEYNVH